MRKTKIICTLGPACDSEEMIEKLMLAGMNVARFNFSHQSHPEHKERYERVDRVRRKLNLPVATLLDTRGPEIRLRLIENGKTELQEGQEFTLTTEDILGNNERVSVTFERLPQDVSEGTHILIDDGLIDMIVTSVEGTEIHCKVLNGGTISNRKGVNVPDTRLSMPFISEQDRSDLLFGIETGFDFVAASFTRTADDIREMRKILDENGGSHMKIIAKIENSEGVSNVGEIIQVADGIMVARGDMGVEISYENIPAIQKKLIKCAYNAGKQVITATQMLDSMMKNPRPTRAEITDVANAVYDGTSAIMLSGETAAGLYPIESLKTMVVIAERTEADIDYENRFRTRPAQRDPDVTDAISHATVTTALDLDANCIITVTVNGRTARQISKYRPKCDVIACSPREYAVRQLNLVWGVTPVLVEEKKTTDELFAHAYEKVMEHGLVQKGELVVTTAGIPLGVSGNTNLLRVDTIGEQV